MKNKIIHCIISIVYIIVSLSFCYAARNEKNRDSLIVVLKNKNARVKAANALADIGDKHSIEALINVLQDRDENVRFMVILSLGRIGDKKVIEPLMEILSEARSSPVVFRFASYGLPISVPCSTYVPTMGDDSIASLEEIQNATEWALENIGEPAVPALIGALKDESASVRYLILNTLRGIDDDRIIKAIIGLLKDEEEYIRANAAQILGYKGDEDCIEPLEGLLEDETELVKRSAAIAIKELKKKSEQVKESNRKED
jgi:HEAT repeat protein